MQSLSERRRHGEDLGAVSKLEDPVDAVGGSPLVGDLVLVPAQEKRRALVTANGLHLAIHPGQSTSRDLYLAAGSVLTKGPTGPKGSRVNVITPV